MKEVWKPINGYEGRYEVSNLGRVASLNYRLKGERHLLKNDMSSGYAQVKLYAHNDFSRRTVHRLVAEAFVNNPNNYGYVNHIDEDKTNNRADNLEWCTFKQNINHGTRTERASASAKGKNAKAVIATLQDGTKEIYQSVSGFYEANDMPKNGNVSLALHGKRKTAYGRTWRFASDI